MSKKKQSKAASIGRVIDLDALLGRWPTIRVAGIEFEGREMTMPETTAWLQAELDDDNERQAELTHQYITARGGAVTREWIDAQPKVYLRSIVRGIYGAGWPGDEEGEGGN